MQESPPSGIAENPAVGRPEALTPEAAESILGEFRAWLLENATATAADGEAVTLDRVLEQFTALRHEVNLQTRASRTQMEQNGQTLQRLDEALHSLRHAVGAMEELDREAEEEHLRPLLKAVVEVHDNLLRAHRETQKVRDALLPLLSELAEPIPTPPVPPTPSGSWWSGWFGGGKPSRQEDAWQRCRDLLEERSRQMSAAVQRVTRTLEGLLAGYKMGQEKVETVLRRCGLEPMPAEGETYDPERMEVLEVVPGSGRPNNEVLEEVRRGYLWRGRVFRYALVRVAKG